MASMQIYLGIISIVLICLMITFMHLVAQLHPKESETIDEEGISPSTSVTDATTTTTSTTTSPVPRRRVPSINCSYYANDELGMKQFENLTADERQLCEEELFTKLLPFTKQPKRTTTLTPAILYRGINISPLTLLTTTSPRPPAYEATTHRRPIREKELAQNIIFKVVDEDGSPKLEIKINNMIPKNKPTRKHLTHDDTMTEDEAAQVVILKMLPDNVIVIDDYKHNRTSTEILDQKSREKIINVVETILGNNVTFVNSGFVFNTSNGSVKDTIVDFMLKNITYENTTENISSMLNSNVSTASDMAKADVT